MQRAFCQSFFSLHHVRLVVLFVALVATGCDQDAAEKGNKPVQDQPNQLVDQSTEQEAPELTETESPCLDFAGRNPISRRTAERNGLAFVRSPVSSKSSFAKYAC